MTVLMSRAGEGAGDQILALNCALAWAYLYETPVELEYHWYYDQDVKYVDGDPEMMGERTDLMLSKMWKPDLIHLEHVWGSDVFNYHGGDFLFTEEALEYRRIVQPRKWFLPQVTGSKELHKKNIPFGGLTAQAEWTWAEEPSTSKKIVIWDFEQNREAVKDYKNVNRGIDWIHIREKAYKLFPDYEFVDLTYRDSFQKAYDEIRDCAFCLGYDGMWHLVARNFGKLFVTFTDNIQHAHKATYPSCAAFWNEQLFDYLEKLTDPEYLKIEQDVAYRWHRRRMEWYESFKR